PADVDDPDAPARVVRGHTDRAEGQHEPSRIESRTRNLVGEVEVAAYAAVVRGGGLVSVQAELDVGRVELRVRRGAKVADGAEEIRLRIRRRPERDDADDRPCRRERVDADDDQRPTGDRDGLDR